MDLKAVKTFQNILASGSFNRAAEELNYAQSTVTMQIQKLESALGVQLFERSHKTVRLTEAGRLFHERSLRITQDIDQLIASLTDLKAGETGWVRLGAIEPAASARMPALLRGFVERFPRIRVSVEIANTHTLAEKILKGELDFALCSAPEWTSDLYFHPLYEEEFIVLMPEHHSLADRESVTPEELASHRLLITAANCPYRRKLGLVLQEAGTTLSETMEIGSMTALPSYVAQGLGVALVPRVALNSQLDGTLCRPLKGEGIDMTCGLLCKAADFPPKLAGARLYDHIKQSFDRTGS